MVEPPEGFSISENSALDDQLNAVAVPSEMAVTLVSSPKQSVIESKPETKIFGSTVIVVNAVSEAGHNESNMYKLTVYTPGSVYWISGSKFTESTSPFPKSHRK